MTRPPLGINAVVVHNKPDRFVLTARIGTNADLLADAFRIFVPSGVTVADVTYGRGNF